MDCRAKIHIFGECELLSDFLYQEISLSRTNSLVPCEFEIERVNCIVRVEQDMASQKDFSINEIKDYVRRKDYPNDMDKRNYGLKFNGRSAASTFMIMN